MTDARTDLFLSEPFSTRWRLECFPFKGDTSAVVFDAILNRDPAPLNQLNPSLPQELNRIIGQALEKDRDMRYQTATELKTALKETEARSRLGTTCRRYEWHPASCVNC